MVKETNRNFKMSYGKLIDISLEKVAYAERDLEKFAAFGFTNDDLQSIKVMINEFSNTDHDDQLMARQVLISSSKKQVSAELKSKLSNLNVRIDLAYGRDNKEFVEHFTVRELSQLSIPNLLIEAKKIIRMVDEYREKLEQIGLSDEIINSINDLIATLEETSVNHKIAMANRDLSTAERHTVANELYYEIIDICKIGKAVWADVNEAYYNDYIIYDTVSSNTDEQVGEEDEVTDVWVETDNL